jgi:carboxymethylenebutenolidase
MSRTVILATLSLSLGLVALGARALAARAIENHAAKTANTAGAGSSGSLSDLDRMAAEHQHDRPAATPAATAAPAQPVSAEEVAFGEVQGQPARGYLARPQAPATAPPGGHAAAPAPLPGIIVIHEWWGLNDNIKAATRRLAGEGYTALAVDLYGGKVADNPDAAKQLAGGVMANREAALAVLRAADDYLKRQGAPRIGVIGWCFGGGWSLQTALEIPQGINAVVMYYGQPEKDRVRLSGLRSPLLGLFGADDKSIPPAAVRELEANLKQLGKSAEIHIYDGAGHAFANPSGTNYRPAAAEDAWRRTVAFFKQHLKGA